MTIFAILMPLAQPVLAQKIKQEYPQDNLEISDTQYLVSSKETVVEVTARLHIVNTQNPAAPASGNAIVFAVSSYYGRASAVIWDWIKSRLEKPTNG